MASDKHGQPSSSFVASCSQASDSPSTYEVMPVTSDTPETELSVYEHMGLFLIYSLDTKSVLFLRAGSNVSPDDRPKAFIAGDLLLLDQRGIIYCCYFLLLFHVYMCLCALYSCPGEPALSMKDGCALGKESQKKQQMSPGQCSGAIAVLGSGLCGLWHRHQNPATWHPAAWPC